MDDERDVAQVEGLDECVEIAFVILVRVREVRLVGLPHPDQVDRDRAVAVGHEGDDVAPQVGRCRIPVEEENRLALALVDVVHARAQDLYVTGLVGKVRRDG